MWFIAERMDGSVNITELQLLPSAVREKLGAVKLLGRLSGTVVSAVTLISTCAFVMFL